MRTVAGIDVRAHKLDVACLTEGQQPIFAQFEQGPAGHDQLVAFLKKHHVEAVVMDATGNEYPDAAMALVQAGVPVSVINPHVVHDFVKVMRHCSNTARIDASGLTEHSLGMNFNPWHAPQDEWLP